MVKTASNSVSIPYRHVINMSSNLPHTSMASVSIPYRHVINIEELEKYGFSIKQFQSPIGT